jgi:hypothetical protein
MIEDLEFRIGGLEIWPDRLSFTGRDPYDASHKFVVEHVDNKVSIYVTQADGHFQIATRFRLPENRLVGGGSCYIDGNGRLVLNHCSETYKAIPKEAAQIFVELLVPELEKKGIQTRGILAEPDISYVHKFWKKKDNRK